MAKLIVKAAHFAAEKHKFQKRKSDLSPYINHPLAVADLLRRAGVSDPETLAAAILHDVVEDTGTSLKEVEAAFGPTVTFLVEAVTGDKSLGQVGCKKQQLERAKHCQDARVAQIKLADKLHNLASFFDSGLPQDWSLERVRGYFVWSKCVTDCLVTHNSWLADKLFSLYQKDIEWDGKLVPVLPLGDTQHQLQAYYKLLEKSQ